MADSSKNHDDSAPPEQSGTLSVRSVLRLDGAWKIVSADGLACYTRSVSVTELAQRAASDGRRLCVRYTLRAPGEPWIQAAHLSDETDRGDADLDFPIFSSGKLF